MTQTGHVGKRRARRVSPICFSHPPPQQCGYTPPRRRVYLGCWVWKTGAGCRCSSRYLGCATNRLLATLCFTSRYPTVCCRAVSMFPPTSPHPTYTYPAAVTPPPAYSTAHSSNDVAPPSRPPTPAPTSSRSLHSCSNTILFSTGKRELFSPQTVRRRRCHRHCTTSPLESDRSWCADPSACRSFPFDRTISISHPTMLMSDTLAPNSSFVVCAAPPDLWGSVTPVRVVVVCVCVCWGGFLLDTGLQNLAQKTAEPVEIWEVCYLDPLLNRAATRS